MKAILPILPNMLTRASRIIDCLQLVESMVGSAFLTSSSALFSSSAVVFESMAFALIFLLSRAYTLQAARGKRMHQGTLLSLRVCLHGWMSFL